MTRMITGRGNARGANAQKRLMIRVTAESTFKASDPWAVATGKWRSKAETNKDATPGSVAHTMSDPGARG